MRKEKFKVLFFIPDLAGGGAEKVLCNLVNNMNPSRYDITVHTVNHYDSELYLKSHIHYKSIIPNRSEKVKALYRVWYRFCTHFKLTYPLYLKGDYDIEVAYLECGATKVLAASTNRKAKKVAWVHCDVIKKGLTAEKVGDYYSKYDEVICVSKAAKKSFDTVFASYAESSVLYNVIDEDVIFNQIKGEEEIQWDNNLFHIITVGRLCNEKGTDRIVEICKLLKKDGKNFVYHILGDGPDRVELESMMRENNLSENVDFMGFKLNPYPYINEADLVVIPSRTEALSTVAIESLILGKIVVTTPCSGMRELFGDSEYGVVTEDSAESLYKEISKIMCSPERRNILLSASRARGIQFSKNETVITTEKFFEKLVREAR